MPILRERNDLDKKWTWYLFLLANVCVLIGCAATWMMIAKHGADLNLIWLPTVICDLVAIGLTIVFMYLESKEILPKSMHFQRKWLWWYLSSLIVFVCVLLFVIIYFVFAIQQPLEKLPQYISELRGNKQYILIIYIVITGVFTLVSIGLQRYARFRIDLDIYRRKHGQDPKAESKKDKKSHGKKDKYFDSDEKASSGLLKEMDKK